MSIPLVEKMRNPGNATYYSVGWANCVEDHILFFQDSTISKPYRPTGMERSRYKGRFYAFLRDVIKETKPEYYYVYLRTNNMTSPDQFGEKYDLLMIPDTSKIEQIYTRYMSSIPT